MLDKLDLSFTKTEEWRLQRERQWAVLRDDLADEFTRKHLKIFEKYFFTGELDRENIRQIGLLSRVSMFPLKSVEAWELLYPKVIRDVTVWREEIQGVFQESSFRKRGWSQQEHFKLFDYLLGAHFKPVVERSRFAASIQIMISHK